MGEPRTLHQGGERVSPERQQTSLKAFMQGLDESVQDRMEEAFGLLTRELADTWEEERGVNIPQGWAVGMMAEDAAERLLLDLGPVRLASPLFWDLYQSARERRLSGLQSIRAAIRAFPG